MKRIVLGSFAGVAVAVTATLVTPDPASASGFLSARFGGEHGHPTTDNPTALYYNPAGLALGHGTRIYLDGTFALRSASYDRPVEAIDHLSPAGTAGPGTPEAAVAGNSGEATLQNFIASPFAAVVTDFGVKNLGVGLGVYFPFGGQAVWDENGKYADDARYPGANDGVNRWWSMDGTIRSMYVTLGGAYRLEGPKLSFGAGLNLVSTQVNTIRARNSDGTDDMTTSDGGLQEGRSWVDVKSLDVAASAGVIWQPTEDVFVGLSYQSQPGFGELTLDGTLDTALGTAQIAEPADVTMTESLPDVIRAGVRFKAVDKVWVRVYGEYVRWSVFENQCLLQKDTAESCSLNDDGSIAPDNKGVIILNIPRKWEDAFGVRAGASYHWQPGWEFYAGGGYDGNAVPDETLDPALMDMNKATVALGGRFRLTDGVHLAPTFTQVIYFERTVEVQERNASGERTGGFASPSRQPDAAGVYNQSISLLNLNLEFEL